MNSTLNYIANNSALNNLPYDIDLFIDFNDKYLQDCRTTDLTYKIHVLYDMIYDIYMFSKSSIFIGNILDFYNDDDNNKTGLNNYKTISISKNEVLEYVKQFNYMVMKCRYIILPTFTKMYHTHTYKQTFKNNDNITNNIIHTIMQELCNKYWTILTKRTKSFLAALLSYLGHNYISLNKYKVKNMHTSNKYYNTPHYENYNEYDGHEEYVTGKKYKKHYKKIYKHKNYKHNNYNDINNDLTNDNYINNDNINNYNNDNDNIYNNDNDNVNINDNNDNNDNDNVNINDANDNINDINDNINDINDNIKYKKYNDIKNYDDIRNYE